MIRRVWGRRGVRVHAPYATRYQWGYLHEALEVDGAHAVELLFTPAIDRDIHALFLRQIADSDPLALHVVIAVLDDILNPGRIQIVVDHRGSGRLPSARK